MKRLIAIGLAVLMVSFMLCGCAKEDPDAERKRPSALPRVVYATIEVEGFGTIELELYPKIAPQSVYNFCYLAKQGYYDGLTIHRVVSGFMIQGGSANGNGTGGPGYCIKGEFAKNGFENTLSHTRGVISMARKSSPMDSASSQFFICHADCTFLDGSYAAFGKVTSGMDVVDAIAAVAVSGETPIQTIIIKTITVSGADSLPEPNKLPEQ